MDFTKLVENGKKMYIEKHLKKRRCGKCSGCQKYSLLIEYADPEDNDFQWSLCDSCYDHMIFNER